ncbi:DUF6468 domain-containing protein [Brevundimonas sp.]|uniref:DUF6468 domain-containing protein n=1 Tax=Brevundimonas sp. TaxID=1871086 RepID=UPI00286AA984|nr:DUF6468 domain-containing protein [Brevundimonas sp.]
MTGMILDAVLMLLLVAALGYGVRLEKKLTQLRAGQLAFAGAVTELNAACARAESALGSLRASGEEADLLHDRIIKARTLKTELEQLIARGVRGALPQGEVRPARVEEPRFEAPSAAPVPERPAPVAAAAPDPDDRAFRMAALAERIHGMAAPVPAAAGAGNVQAILHALTANQAAKQTLNRARVNLASDDDLFAA